MKNKLFALIVSIALIAVGCIVSYCVHYEPAQIIGFAVTMFGAGLAVNQLWEGRDKKAKSGLVVLGIVLIGLGSFLAGLLSLMDVDQLKTYVGLIFSVIVFIAGLVSVAIANKTAKQLK